MMDCDERDQRDRNIRNIMEDLSAAYHTAGDLPKAKAVKAQEERQRWEDADCDEIESLAVTHRVCMET